ncbi:protein kinase, ATP binding site-containing protein [Tanacetum coccineum]
MSKQFAHLRVPLDNILSATNNFAEEYVIGEGGFGKRYKGQLLWSGDLINIMARRFNKGRNDGEQLLWTEISMLSSLEHKNLVSLVGFCDENDEKIIIIKLEIRGNLINHLSNPMLLTWVRRLETCVVPLNDDWEPKLYYFDFSMKIKASQRYHSFHTNRLAYEPGKSIIDNNNNKYLAPLAITHYREKTLYDIIDRDLLKQMDPQSFNILAEAAYDCLNEEQSRRPNIDEIVLRLEKALELQLKPENYDNSIGEGTSSSFIHKKFQHLKVELQAIKSATNGFDDSHCIGKGGFGKVYKGELVHSKGQSVVAIKRLDRAFGQGDPEFWKEIIMLSLYRHDNIVSLRGFCDDCGEKILVYDYASKRSLDLYLNDKDLTWVQRLEICIGAARGLAYLHNPGQTQQRVLHRDIKSSNILLDENWNARIADLGLSKFGPANQRYTFLVSNGVGTIGYCDPLYLETGLLTKELDVYSFGVVLFEILCGRLCISYKHDERLTALAFTTIAYQCLNRDQEQRPLMTEVVKELESALICQYAQWLTLVDVGSKWLCGSDPEVQDGEVMRWSAQFLSPNVVYGVYLVFQFCDSRNCSTKPIFSMYCCGDGAFFLEGIEFQAIGRVKHEESKKLKEVQQVFKSNFNVDQVQPLPTKFEEIFKIHNNHDELFWLSEVNGKKFLVLSAKAALYKFSNVDLFTSIPSAESSKIYKDVYEFLPQQAFFLKCTIRSQMLSPDTEYVCYLVFKLSETCQGLHYPVKVRDVLHQENNEAEFVYFITPSPLNIHGFTRIPKQRDDGWMEIQVWKFNSTHEIKDDSLSMNMKFTSHEGAMVGLIVSGLEFRPL